MSDGSEERITDDEAWVCVHCPWTDSNDGTGGPSAAATESEEEEEQTEAEEEEQTMAVP